MRFNGDRLYRVRVTRYPDGAFQPVGPVDPDHPEDAIWEPVPGWTPPGWRPEGNYAQMLGTSEFVWPTTNQVWGSRTTAKKRADLLARFGATAVVERSSRIVWPSENDGDRVLSSEQTVKFDRMVAAEFSVTPAGFDRGQVDEVCAAFELSNLHKSSPAGTGSTGRGGGNGASGPVVVPPTAGSGVTDCGGAS